MYDFLTVLEEGTNDPDQLVRAARWAIVNRMPGSEAAAVVALALDEFGPEYIYMDGELFAEAY